MAAKARHTLTVSVPVGRINPQGENYKEATPRPASSSCPSVWQPPPCTCSPVLRFRVVGGGTRGFVVGGGKRGRSGQKRGCTEGSAPGGAAQAQWPLPQAGGGNMAE